MIDPNPIIRPTYVNPAWTAGTSGRDKKRADTVVTSSCEVCTTSVPEVELHYLYGYGNRVCGNCIKDLKKTPCPDCFTIHAGECY